MKIEAFIRSALNWNNGGIAVQTRKEYRSRLKICEGCRWRTGLFCNVAECHCQIQSFALNRDHKCPLGRWRESKPPAATISIDGPEAGSSDKPPQSKTSPP